MSDEVQDELDVSSLNEKYTKAESCDREIFSEMRSNVLMVSGRHYQRTSSQINQRLDLLGTDSKTKIRLVQNRIYRNTRIYINEIIAQSPGVRVLPHVESELQDQKAAEIANSVWQDAKSRYKLNERIKDFAASFVEIGEVAVKIFWDKNKGKIVGYQQAQTDDGQDLFTDHLGNDTTDTSSPHPLTGLPQDHEPKPGEIPVYSGDFVFESILPFNLLRDPSAENMDDARFLIVRKMMEMDDAKALCGGDEKKEAFLVESMKTTFRVFDGNSGEFVDSKNQILVREFYFRPCLKYPNGWVSISTENGVLWEDELPFGIFPIVWRGFQKIHTTPRAHSIIRVARPFQAEINRMASSSAENSIAFGSDKLLVQATQKVEKGMELPGVRVIKYGAGPVPQFLAGRNGEQFIAGIQDKIQGMDDAMMIAKIQEDTQGSLDPNTLLFRSMKQKKTFSFYAVDFQGFLTETCQVFLKLAQKYLPDDAMIKRIGKREYINIPEFKDVSDLDFSIKLDDVSDDIETTLGKSLQIQQVLQYAGKQLSPEQLGQVICEMPFVNADQMFQELTMDKRNADSDILAMDRGQMINARTGENHDYVLKRITSRMKDRSFDILPPQIQQNYELKRQQHEQVKAQELQQLKQLQSEFIPTGGALVSCDVWTEVPDSRGGMKTSRARVPYEAVQWLLDAIEKQGMSQKSIEQQAQGTQGDIAQQFLSHQQQMGAQPGAGPQMHSPHPIQPTQGLEGSHGSPSPGLSSPPGSQFNPSINGHVGP